MSKWLFSVVGVVFLGVLFDMIYPNGKTNAFCKGLFGLFTVYVLISPLINFKVNIDDNYSIVDTSIVECINNAKNDAMIVKVKNSLESIGLYNVNVEIDYDMANSEYVVENIYIDVSNLVLENNDKNINIYEVITNKIKAITEIQSERIVFYG